MHLKRQKIISLGGCWGQPIPSINHSDLRKNQEEMLEIKNIVTKMKNTFDGFISRLTTDEERISKLEDLSIESSKIKMEREQRLKQNRIPKDCGATTKTGTYT